MFTKARNYVLQNAIPAYREFFAALRRNTLGEATVVRLGVNAAVALYHLREHLPEPRPEEDRLQEACPDWALVRDVANASKHRKLSRGRPRLTNADQIYEVAVSTQYKDKKGEYPVAQVAVRLKLDNGTERDLAEVLHHVMTMWSGELRKLGIVNIANPETLPQDRHVTRAEAARRKMRTEVVKGEERRQRWVIRHFNYVTGRSEPIDLTGAKIVYSVWKPIESIPVHVEWTERQLEADVEIPVTASQGAEFSLLETDEDRNRFVAGLLKRSPRFQRRFGEALQKILAETKGRPPKPRGQR